MKIKWKALLNWVKKLSKIFKKKGGGTMKMVLFLTVLCFGLMIPWTVKAQDFNIDLHQGFLLMWEDQSLKNLTCVDLAKTKPVEGWGKWNALWDGWILSAGWAYDSSTLDSAALLIGRDFGVLGKYLPIAYPLADKLTISIYPIGIYATGIFYHMKVQGASGGAIVKLGLKF